MLLVRGQPDAVAARIRERAARASNPVTVGSSPRQWSWSAALTLLDQLRARRPSTLLDRGARQAVDLITSTSPSRITRAPGHTAFGARLTSHLTHNWLQKRPLVEALARGLTCWIDDAKATVLVPDLAAVDHASRMVLEALVRHGLRRIIVGHRIVPLDAIETDSDGIVWQPRPLGVFQLAASMLMVNDAALVEVDAADPSAVADTPPMPAQQPVAEDACWAELQHAPTADHLETSVDLVRARFRTFGFRSSLRLGIALLEHADRLTTPDRADVLAIVALSAHNRQFRAEGNRALGRFIVAKTRAALAIESRPAVRSALWYRLAVGLGRRLERFEEAETAAAAGIEEAADLPAADAAYLAAWSHNIRAYARMRQRNPTGATEDCMQATALLRPFTGDAQRRHDRGGHHRRGQRQLDMDASAALFASGVSILRISQRDQAGFETWRELADHLAPAHPSERRFVPAAWVGKHRGDHRPDLAWDRATEGAAACRADLDPVTEYRYLFIAADQAYRLGRVAEALATYDGLRARIGRYGASPFLRAPDLPSVPTRVAAGDHARAATLLSNAIADDVLSPHQAVEAQMWLARIAEARGDGHRAEQHADRAIDTAVASGHRETLAHAAAALGDLAARLERVNDARLAYLRARDLTAAHNTDETTRHRWAVDRMRALIGLVEIGSASVSMDEVIALVPASLAQSDGWWLLPRLLAGLVVELRRGATPDPEAIALLYAAAALREDCRRDLQIVRALPFRARTNPLAAGARMP